MTAEVPVSFDRARVIRWSLECFQSGLVGLIPVLGLSRARQAAKLCRQIGEETREPGVIALANAGRGYPVAALVLALAFLVSDSFGRGHSSIFRHLSGLEVEAYINQIRWVAALAVLLISRQAWLLWRQYRLGESPDWNPGRNLVFWGAGFAYAGVVISSLVVVMACIVAVHAVAP